MLCCPNATSVCYAVRKLTDRSPRPRKAKNECVSHFLPAYSWYIFNSKIIFKGLNPKQGAAFHQCK